MLKTRVKRTRQFAGRVERIMLPYNWRRQLYRSHSSTLQLCLYLVRFLKYTTPNNGVSLRSRLWVVRGHWKWYHSTDRTRLDECKPTTPERQQDKCCGSAPGITSTDSLTVTVHDWGTSLVVYCWRRRRSTRPWRWQPVVNGRPRGVSLSLSILRHLRQIRPTLQSLSRDAANTLVQAFISSRLDYCNSVLYGVTDNCTKRCRQVNHADGSP